MDSAKSLNLLAVAHNYRKQGKRVILMKPRLDTRFGAQKISSRAGLEADADVMIDEETALDPRDFANCDCVLVDEAQFLPPQVIEDLRRITVDPGVPVICYGLRTDFRTKLFPGAQRLMELADRIEDRSRGRKIHVGDPERHEVAAAENTLVVVPFVRPRITPIDYRV